MRNFKKLLSSKISVGLGLWACLVPTVFSMGCNKFINSSGDADTESVNSTLKNGVGFVVYRYDLRAETESEYYPKLDKDKSSSSATSATAAKTMNFNASCYYVTQVNQKNSNNNLENMGRAHPYWDSTQEPMFAIDAGAFRSGGAKVFTEKLAAAKIKLPDNANSDPENIFASLEAKTEADFKNAFRDSAKHLTDMIQQRGDRVKYDYIKAYLATVMYFSDEAKKTGGIPCFKRHPEYEQVANRIKALKAANGKPVPTGHSEEDDDTTDEDNSSSDGSGCKTFIVLGGAQQSKRVCSLDDALKILNMSRRSSKLPKHVRVVRGKKSGAFVITGTPDDKVIWD